MTAVATLPARGPYTWVQVWPRLWYPWRAHFQNVSGYQASSPAPDVATGQQVPLAGHGDRDGQRRGDRHSKRQWAQTTPSPRSWFGQHRPGRSRAIHFLGVADAERRCSLHRTRADRCPSDRSRTWPNEARTTKSRPRIALIFRVFPGDSTMTRCGTAHECTRSDPIRRGCRRTPTWLTTTTNAPGTRHEPCTLAWEATEETHQTRREHPPGRVFPTDRHHQSESRRQLLRHLAAGSWQSRPETSRTRERPHRVCSPLTLVVCSPEHVPVRDATSGQKSKK